MRSRNATADEAAIVGEAIESLRDKIAGTRVDLRELMAAHYKATRGPIGREACHQLVLAAAVLRGEVGRLVADVDELWDAAIEELRGAE